MAWRTNNIREHRPWSGERFKLEIDKAKAEGIRKQADKLRRMADRAEALGRIQDAADYRSEASALDASVLP